MTRTYEFRPDGAFLVWVAVHISGTRKEMNAHVARFFKKRGTPLESDEHTAGLSTPTPTRAFPGEKGEWNYDRIVTVFLNHEDLRKNPREIIPHEALHAAMTHERAVAHFDMRYSPSGRDEMEHEERLAYKVGQISAGLYRTLAKDKRLRKA